MLSRTFHALACFGYISAALGSLAWADVPTRGNGIFAETHRDAHGIDTIRADGLYRLAIVKRSEYGITISGDSNIVPLIKTKITRRTLSISEVGWIHPEIPLDVTVYLPTLKSLSLSRAISAHIDAFSGRSIHLEASGAVHIEADDLQFGKLSAKTDGSSFLRISGHSGKLELTAVDSSHFAGEGFTAGMANVQVAGSSQVNLGECDRVTGTVTDSSLLNYHGSPASAASVRVSQPAAIRYINR